MVKHTIIAVLIGLFIFGLYLAQYVGMFKTVTVGLENRPAFSVVAKKHVGAYHKIVPVIQEVEAWFKKNSLDCRFSFGEYYDNPNTVEEGRLNSIGGCLISEKDMTQLKEWSQTLPADYFIKEIPAQRFVVANFEGSPGVGPFKVYPKVQNFSLGNQVLLLGPNFEIYEIFEKNKMNTTYLFYIKDEASTPSTK